MMKVEAGSLIERLVISMESLRVFTMKNQGKRGHMYLFTLDAPGQQKMMKPYSARRDVDFGRGIGKKPVYLLYVWLLPLLVKRSFLLTLCSLKSNPLFT
jgi:hypothetical protein